MTTTVVNKRSTEAYTVDIGRPSPLGNPFIIGTHGDRKRVIKRFRYYFYRNEHLKKLARETCQDEILGCYCKPLACHGDVIAEYLNGLKRDEK